MADAADEAELGEIYETERRLLYVACTRAAADRQNANIRISRRFRPNLLTTQGSRLSPRPSAQPLTG